MREYLPLLAVRKAMTQHWDPRTSFGAAVGAEINIGWEQSAMKMWQAVFMDQAFWVALAKAGGWESLWKYNALRGIDLALSRQDMTAFWAELLRDKYTI